MISHFFIDRPIFASVLSIVLVLAGFVAWRALPVEQYPNVTPPTVQVTALYPGANAVTVRDTVAAPIEEQVSGVEGMMYMSSQSTNDGAYKLIVTFKLGFDSDMAQVLVQNRVSLALPVIPSLVQTEGIDVRKIAPSTLMIVNLISPDGRYDSTFLSNYATIYIKDELARLDGIAAINLLGQRDYSLRAWLDPDKLAALNLTPMDVVNAISQQNLQVAAGQIGQPPALKAQQFQLTINTLGRLTDPEQFANIIVKAANGTGTTAGGTTSGAPTGTGAGGIGAVGRTNSMRPMPPATGIVQLKDVVVVDPKTKKPWVELGSQQYNQTCTLDGQESVALSIFTLPGSNALATAKKVYAKMTELKRRFPDGIDYRIVYDTTPFISESIDDVYRTLRDAIILVAIVVLVFLQKWRATLIPLIAVPVALVGTFAVMAALGFSLNTLSLFGLVLAIGIVVDDAIVVVENVERWLEQGVQPREAARRAMDEVTGPVIAVALVLCAVFVPCTFLGGVSGQFFRQFAVTISVSTVISAFNSLTLSPALAALLLKPRLVSSELLASRSEKEWDGQHDLPPATKHLSRTTNHTPPTTRDPLTWLLDISLGWFFRGFNSLFGAGTALYTRGVAGLLRVSLITLLVYAGLLVLTYVEFTRAPTGFIPEQDAGYLMLTVQLPDAASVERTQKVMAHIDKLAHATPGVAHTVGISGQSLILNANAPNLGSMYVLLNEFDERRGSSLSANAIAADLTERCRREVPGAIVTAFGPPPIAGLGTTGGFKLIIEDRANLGLDELQRVSQQVVARGNKTTGLEGLFTSASANSPWLFLDIDRTKCMALGVAVNNVFSTLQIYLGSYYVNNFNEFGRTWQVNLQAGPGFRGDLGDILRLQVRNNQGQMIRLGTLMSIRDTSGPVALMRYNMYAASAVTGNGATGTSSGQAIKLMQEIANRALPESMASEWTELTYLQLAAGNQAMFVFALAVIFVFLVLAAQYESWSLPLAVILVVPMCLLCSVVGVRSAAMEVNLFTQIGFVVLVGLASKNAILIVEFAKQKQEAGMSSREATLEACRLRLRPILMTSFAFILGVVPLVIATGAGAEMRRALGLAVFSGMLGVTLFGIFLTPVFFYVIQWFSRRRQHPPDMFPPTRTNEGGSTIK
jgi:multidrug efflux pump subunit AcrB